MRMNRKELTPLLHESAKLEAQYDLLRFQQKDENNGVYQPRGSDELELEKQIAEINKPITERLQNLGVITDSIFRKEFPDYVSRRQILESIKELRALDSINPVCRVRVDYYSWFELYQNKDIGLGQLYFTRGLYQSATLHRLPLEVLTFSNWDAAVWTRKVIKEYKARKADEKIEELAAELQAHLKARKRKERRAEAYLLKKNGLYSREGELIETAV